MATNISGVDFGNQEEARAFVKRVGIEYRYGCLEEKDPSACDLLGDYIEAIELNRKGAFEVYKENCLLRNHPFSCFKYGRYLIRGKKSVCEKDLDEALVAFTKSCSGDFMEGCRLKALVELHGTPKTPPNPKDAESVLKRACEAENPSACWQLSSLYLPVHERRTKADTENEESNSEKSSTTERSEVKKPHLYTDFQKAMFYAVQACDLGNYQSCANVSRMYELGDGVEKNLEKAKEFRQKTHDITESVDKGFTLKFGETPKKIGFFTFCMLKMNVSDYCADQLYLLLISAKKKN